MLPFTVASYNVCLSVGPPLVMNGSHARSQRVADAFYASVRDADVVMFQELVRHRDSVLESFTRHPHRTRKVASNLLSDNVRFVSSGLAVASRWPIVKERSMLFSGTTYHYEALMAKGVQYAKLSTPVGFVHIFNTHVNAWATPRAFDAREQQAQQIGAFIKSQSIPRDEYVFVGGDINIDVYEHVDRVSEMMRMIGGVHVPRPSDVSFSCDPLLNALVGTDDASEYATRSRRNGCYDEFMATGLCLCCPRQLVDVIGVVEGHRQVKDATITVEVVKARAPFRTHFGVMRVKSISDVSDHFPVVFRCVLEGQPVDSPVDEGFEPPTQPSASWSVVIAVLTLAYFIVAFSAMWIPRKLYRSLRKR